MSTDNFTKIKPSEVESEILGIKVGRCETKDLDISRLSQQILANEYDLCRLTIPSSNELISDQLDSLGFPFFYSGSVKRYRVNVNKHPAKKLVNENLVFELYDGSQDILLEELVQDTWGIYPIGYYRTPLLNKVFTKEKESKCLARFYSVHFNNSKHPENFLWLISKDQEYVGFVALTKYHDNVVSTIAGIVKKHNTSGVFFDMINHVKEFSMEQQIEWFFTGARSENTFSQRGFEREGFTTYSVDNIFHVPSLLSYSVYPSLHKEINLENDNSFLKEIDISVMEDGLIPDKFQMVSQQIKWFRKPEIKQMDLKINFPVKSDDEFLAVGKFYEGEILSAVTYTRYK